MLMCPRRGLVYNILIVRVHPGRNIRGRKVGEEKNEVKKLKMKRENKVFFYEVGPAAVAVIRMTLWVSLAVAEAPTEALPRVAAIVEADAPLAEEEHVELFLMLAVAVKLDPSLTARIDGVKWISEASIYVAKAIW